jgi:hypothetical protein
LISVESGSNFSRKLQVNFRWSYLEIFDGIFWTFFYILASPIFLWILFIYFRPPLIFSSHLFCQPKITCPSNSKYPTAIPPIQ